MNGTDRVNVFPSTRVAFVPAADPGATSNDTLGIGLVQSAGNLAFFEWLKGGPFVITGTFTIPTTTHIPSESSGVGMGVFFDGGSEGGTTWDYGTGYAGQSLLEDSMTLIDYNPSNAQRAVDVASPGTYGFSFYVSPTGSRISIDGNTLSLEHDPPWDFSQLDEIRISIGEAPGPSDGMIAGGTWRIGPINFYRVDGVAPPWCASFESPGGDETTNMIGDGSVTVFVLRSAYIPLTTRVFINGLLQRRGIEYTESDPGNGEITFTTAPLGTDIISVRYVAVLGEV